MYKPRDGEYIAAAGSRFMCDSSRYDGNDARRPAFGLTVSRAPAGTFCRSCSGAWSYRRVPSRLIGGGRALSWRTGDTGVWSDRGELEANDGAELVSLSAAAGMSSFMVNVRGAVVNGGS